MNCKCGHPVQKHGFQSGCNSCDCNKTQSSVKIEILEAENDALEADLQEANMKLLERATAAHEAYKLVGALGEYSVHHGYFDDCEHCTCADVRVFLAKHPKE